MPAVLHPSQQQFKCSGVYFVAIPFRGNNLVDTLAPQRAGPAHRALSEPREIVDDIDTAQRSLRAGVNEQLPVTYRWSHNPVFLFIFSPIFQRLLNLLKEGVLINLTN